jgi:hypothetical protein
MTETIFSMTETIFSTVKTIVWILSQSFAHRSLLLVEQSFANPQLVVLGAPARSQPEGGAQLLADYQKILWFPDIHSC